jgi:hypothetical protein
VITRFSHPLLGTVTKGMFSSELRSICGRKQLTASVAELKEVAAKLEPWRAPNFELRMRVHLALLLEVGR